MTIRNLDALFAPKSIALIGASNHAGSVGQVLARNLIEAGYPGPIMPVNPHEQAIHSILNYRSVAELPITPDLAVISTPPSSVPQLISELGARGCRAAVVITAGFGEGDQDSGKALRAEMLKAAQPHLMRIIGPNCLGFISPHAGINASFAQLTPRKGDIAFLTQSGAVATAILDWADARNIGFSHLISLGDMSDVDFGDLLDYLALDGKTRAILLYVESITQARKFMTAARIAARTKPVIVVKAGRSAAGAKAAMSHTGAMAGSDAVYDAAFRRIGLLRVYTLQELFEATATLASGMKVPGSRLSILTNGGGIGVLVTDALDDFGGELAQLDEDTLSALGTQLPATWSHGNPVDILGDATGARYAHALKILAQAKNRDAILILNCPTAVADGLESARAVIDTLAQPDMPRVPVLTSWLGENAAREARLLFSENHIPTYETPDQAVRAFMHLVNYRRNHELLMETPHELTSTAPDREKVRTIIRDVLLSDTTHLGGKEARDILQAYGIPVNEVRFARDAEDAANIADQIGYPVALKIRSPDLPHKSDVGGVRLRLASASAVREAAQTMLANVARAAPHALIEGFTIEAMIMRPNAVELIAGIASDPTFGPIILFGQGGVSVEVVGDRAIGLPPMNAALAKDLISRTRISKLLHGYRDHPPADIDAIERVLIALAELASEFDEIVELDINPLLADEHGVIAVDARIGLKPSQLAHSGARLAIRPYPKELERTHTLSDGTEALIRPIRPEDEPRLLDMLARSSQEDIRLRFFSALKTLTHAFAARLTQIDYDREMALCAFTQNAKGEPEMLGVVRLIADPNGESGEFAVFVRSDLKGKGLGYRLMTEILAYAYGRNIGHVFGEVLVENTTMLHVAEQLGFKISREPDDPGICRVDYRTISPASPA